MNHDDPFALLNRVEKFVGDYAYLLISVFLFAIGAFLQWVMKQPDNPLQPLPLFKYYVYFFYFLGLMFFAAFKHRKRSIDLSFIRATPEEIHGQSILLYDKINDGLIKAHMTIVEKTVMDEYVVLVELDKKTPAPKGMKRKFYLDLNKALNLERLDGQWYLNE